MRGIAEVKLRHVKQEEDFLSLLFHELELPLNVIQGFVCLLQARGPGLQAEDARMLGIIKALAEKAVEAVDDFNVLRMVETGKYRPKPKPTCIATLAAFHSEEFKTAAEERKIRIILEIPAKLPEVLLDEAIFSKALSALLSYSIASSVENSAVRVKAMVKNGPPIRVHMKVKRDRPVHYREEKECRLALAAAKALTELQGGVYKDKDQPGRESVTLIFPAA